MDKKIVNRNHVYFYVFLFLLVLLLRIPALYHTIVDIDEAAFAEFANKWINGGIPYVHMYDNKPLLVYFFYYIVFYFFGINNLFAVHAVTIILVYCCAIIIYKFIQNIKGIDEAKAASLFFIFLMHIYEPKYIATNTETLFTLPILISFISYYLFIINKWKTNIALVTSGIFAGISFFINYKAGVILIVYGIFAIFSITKATNKKSECVKQLKDMIVIATGFLMVVAGVTSYLYYNNALDDFITLGFLYNFKYIQSGMTTVPIVKAIARFIIFIVCSLPLWLIAGRHTIHLLKEKQYTPITVISILWLLAGCFSVLLGWRAYGHYFIQLVPPLAILGGLLIKDIAPSLLKKIYIYFIIMMILFTASRINIPLTYHYLGDSNSLSDYAYKNVAHAVTEITAPDDTIFVWGSGAVAYIYANRRCASKILIADYISGRQFGVSNEDMQANVNAYIQLLRKQFIAEIIKNPPAVVIDTSPSGYYGYDKFPLKNFSALYEIINNNYRFAKRIDMMDIYVRKNITMHHSAIIPVRSNGSKAFGKNQECVVPK